MFHIKVIFSLIMPSSFLVAAAILVTLVVKDGTFSP